jgi:hypothetical protein
MILACSITATRMSVGLHLPLHSHIFPNPIVHPIKSTAKSTSNPYVKWLNPIQIHSNHDFCCWTSKSPRFPPILRPSGAFLAPHQLRLHLQLLPGCSQNATGDAGGHLDTEPKGQEIHGNLKGFNGDLYMFIYVYICLYMFIYVYICLYMFICLYMVIYVYMFVYVYIYVYIYICVCVFIYVFIYMFIYMFI